MSAPRQSFFRTALQVTPERFARLTDLELNELMGQLLLAQAKRCSVLVSSIDTSVQIKAKEKGCDGWSEAPSREDTWLGNTVTCWQFKAGKAGEPAKLAKEIIKGKPRETLLAGGRYVVVCSGLTNGRTGRDDRIKKLRDAADKANIPSTKIDVFGSQQLADWANEHPSISGRWVGMPSGVWTLEKWSRSDQHEKPWQAPNDDTREKIEELRKEINPDGGSILHLHIQGQPGVGKTRFALELCRNAQWNNSVIYIDQSANTPVVDLIDDAVNQSDVELVAVVDEVQIEQLRPLREHVGHGNGRIRLITIGHCSSPEPSCIPVHLVNPMDSNGIAKLVRRWNPSLPPEYVDFIADFSEGYVRLAYLATEAIRQDPSVNVKELMGHSSIKVLMDRMLGSGDRRSLYVVASLTAVGWEEEVEQEGKSIAEALKLEWNKVRYDIIDFDRRLGIARKKWKMPLYFAYSTWKSSRA